MERELLRNLRDLGRVTAPPGLAVRVLAGTEPESYLVVEAPWGDIHVSYNRLGVSAAKRVGGDGEFEAWFLESFGRPARRAVAPDGFRHRLQRALAGGGTSLRFDLGGVTEFERAVLRKALEIPHGEVRSYAWVAREIGRPAAVRAVGTALGKNPIPYFIPCHRVVRSTGTIGEYSGGGPEAKVAVLTAEGVDVAALERMGRRGVRYLGSDTTHIFCVPTCRNARRITAAHEAAFGSEAEALAAGYRPCQICRPAAAA